MAACPCCLTALKHHTKGESLKKTQMTVAYSLINTYRYAGSTKQIPLGLHPEALLCPAELTDIRDQIPEFKNVDDF